MSKIPVPAGLVAIKEYKTLEQKKIERERKRQKALAVKIKNKGRHARRKGHQFEREIAMEMRRIGYPQACRQLEYQAGLGVDIANTGIYKIQCKRGKQYAPLSKIKEVPTVEGTIPLLVTRADCDVTLVALPFKHFLELIKKSEV